MIRITIWFETFKSQIVKRQKKGEKLNITFIGVNLPKLIKAEIYNSSFARNTDRQTPVAII